MKFDGYKIKLNLKSCCLFEQITGKNFMKLSNEEDAVELMYCCIVTNNENLLMTYKVFKTFVSDTKVSKWVEREYKKITEFNAQIRQKPVDEEYEKADKKEEEELTITDVVSALIVRYGMDAHYVMYEMDLWEIQPYLNAADIQRKNDLVTQRFWTYMTIAPHINSKKIKSPEELVPFEWEHKRKNKELEKNSEAAFNFLSGQNTQENGTTDNNT